MSNRQPEKKFKLKKIQKTPPADFKFPLPLLDKSRRKPEALPGLIPVNPPNEKTKGSDREKYDKALSKIVEQAKKDLAPWLSESWWKCDEKIVCQSSKFQQAVKEALTIPIAIPKWESLFNESPDQWMNNVVSEWSLRLFNQVTPPNDWVCRVGPGQCVFEPKDLDMKHICRVAEFLPVQSRSINGPLSPGEFGLAFPKGILTATRRSPQVRSRLADLLMELACEIKPKKKPSSEITKYQIHHQAVVSLAFSWWVKRGGSVKKFPELAKQLMPNLISKFSETFAREAKERLTPGLFWSITIIGHSMWNKIAFLSCANSINEAP